VIKTSPLAAAVAAALVLCGAAQAQTWPAKPIRLVVPAVAGSAVDVQARRVATDLAEALGQPIVIDNRPGANSAIGAREVARATPDGYTLLQGNINNSLNDLLLGDACCKLNEALVPITRLFSSPLVMVVNPKVQASDLKGYIALAKAQPQLLTFASGGPGAITQLLGEKVKLAAGINVREIPYKSIGAEMPDLLAGHVDTAYLAPVVVEQNIKAGKLHALGVAGPQRVAIISQVPTMAEAGLPGIEAAGWNGLFAPAGTPDAVIRRLQAETAKVLATPAMKAEAAQKGSEIGGEKPEEYAAFIRAEIAKWGKVIKDSGIKLQ